MTQGSPSPRKAREDIFTVIAPWCSHTLQPTYQTAMTWLKERKSMLLLIYSEQDMRLHVVSF